MNSLFRTPVCELLGIECPIIQGGMAWVSDAQLAAAVSNAGGLGIIAAGHSEPDLVRAEIRKAKELTQKPFGVNVMLMSQYAEQIVDLVIDEMVPVVATGAGNPGRYMSRFREKGIKVVPVVASVALAKRMVREGADAVIVEGTEAGGHVGELTTMALVPQVARAVPVPVIAAGGIATGEGFLAAMSLGAQGVQMGTRFACTKECKVHPRWKEVYIKAGDRDTVVTGRSTGHPVRIIKNKLAREFQKLEKQGAPVEELEKLGEGALRKAAWDGDVQRGSVMAGQIVGLIEDEPTVAEVIQRVLTEAREILDSLCQRYGG